LRDGVFLSYYAAGPAGISLRVKTLPLSWFYQ
jgi:hypothetical protein